MDGWIRWMELLGVISFAASGALVGLQSHMDPFGVTVLGLTTATGGGLLRDLILGIAPPTIFCDPTCALVAIGVSLVLFLPPVRKELARRQNLTDFLMFLTDTAGLGVFTVVGIRTVFRAAPDGTLFLFLFLGVLTGCGGGILRDVLSGRLPYIFSKHIYALAGLAGSGVCYFLWRFSPEAAMLCGCVVVIAIRFLSYKYHWNLPRG